MSLDKVQIITKEIEPAQVQTTSKTITSKHVLVAVTVVLVVALAVGGVLGAMAMNQKSIDNMVKNIIEKHVQTKQVDENIKVDVKERTEEIDSKDKESGNTIKVIHDFKRGLTVYRVEKQCYVSLLNKSSMPTPEEMKSELQNKNTDGKEMPAEKVSLVPSETTMDPSTLGEAARKACEGLSIFWLADEGQSDVPTTKDTKRTKRQVLNDNALQAECRRIGRRYPVYYNYPTCRLRCCSLRWLYKYRLVYTGGRWRIISIYRHALCTGFKALPAGSVFRC